MTAARVLASVLACLISALCSAARLSAQELEPRAYSPSPTGTTFFVVSGTRSSGGVFTDPSAPITDVSAEVGLLGLAAGHSFALLGKSAQLLGVLPIAWGQASGSIGEDRREVSRRGLADPRVRFSLILAGSPPMTPSEFARRRRGPIVGTSVTIVPPVGQYDRTKLVNLGSNRWSVKPEVGLSVPAGRWTIDTYAGVWMFSDNDAYFPGSGRREQDPVVALQGHVSYALGRRAWIAVNATWYGGGKTAVDGARLTSPYRNARVGATWAVPVGARQSLKIAYSAGATTRVGADFRTLTGAWQIVLF